MVLIKVDLPQPFGPRIATCSPAPMRSVMSWSTRLSPSITETCWKASKAGAEFISREYTASMRHSGLVLLLVSFCPLAFGQLDSNSITVSVSRNASLQPDQAIFGVTVQSGLGTGLDDVIAALQGSGITAANFSGVSTQEQLSGTFGSVTQPPQLTLLWVFTLPVPLTKTKDTVASLTTLQQSIAKANAGLTLSFSIAGTQVSQQLAQSQTCSLPGLIADATAQAQSLAAAGGLYLGAITAMSSATSNVASSPQGLVISGAYVSAFSSALTAPPPCAITVKFVATRF